MHSYVTVLGHSRSWQLAITMVTESSPRTPQAIIIFFLLNPIAKETNNLVYINEIVMKRGLILHSQCQ